MTRAVETPGRFIVLDGVDGCGKTTQARLLCAALAARRGAEPLHLREPGSTPLGEELRRLLLESPEELDAGVEALLLAAARRHMLRTLVAPALAAGRDVVCERFHPSTFAYQGVAGELGEERVLAFLDEWAGAPRPDRIVLLELEPALALERRGPAGDRIEARAEGFRARVADGYRRYAERAHADEAVRIVSASGAPEAVHARVLEAIDAR